MKAPTQNERQRRIAEAVADPEWQMFREGLRGMDTESKLNNLAEYYGEQCHDEEQPDPTQTVEPLTCLVCIRVDNYLKALARGGQLPAGVSLKQALLWDWNLRILK
jgi:hypothetical protein